MGTLKKNSKAGLSVVSKLIWPSCLSAISTFGAALGRRSAGILGSIRHPPKLMSHLAAVSRRTSDLPCNMNPALLLIGHFYFFAQQQMVKHIHTRSLTLMLQPPRGAISPPLSTFPVFRSQFLLIEPITPRGCTWKRLLFRPYLTGERPLLHKRGSITHLAFGTIVPFPNSNCKHQMYFLCQLIKIITIFFFVQSVKNIHLEVERAVAMQ